jgi:hypothetical protein
LGEEDSDLLIRLSDFTINRSREHPEKRSSLAELMRQWQALTAASLIAAANFWHCFCRDKVQRGRPSGTAAVRKADGGCERSSAIP